MNATNDLNAPYRRNDAYTTHAVMSHIQAKYPGEFGERHIAACINEARRANDAAHGCRIADGIAITLRSARMRFCKRAGWV